MQVNIIGKFVSYDTGGIAGKGFGLGAVRSEGTGAPVLAASAANCFFLSRTRSSCFGVSSGINTCAVRAVEGLTVLPTANIPWRVLKRRISLHILRIYCDMNAFDASLSLWALIKKNFPKKSAMASEALSAINRLVLWKTGLHATSICSSRISSAAGFMWAPAKQKTRGRLAL